MKEEEEDAVDEELRQSIDSLTDTVNQTSGGAQGEKDNLVQKALNLIVEGITKLGERASKIFFILP